MRASDSITSNCRLDIAYANKTRHLRIKHVICEQKQFPCTGTSYRPVRGRMCFSETQSIVRRQSYLILFSCTEKWDRTGHLDVHVHVKPTSLGTSVAFTSAGSDGAEVPFCVDSVAPFSFSTPVAPFAFSTAFASLFTRSFS